MFKLETPLSNNQSSQENQSFSRQKLLQYTYILVPSVLLIMNLSIFYWDQQITMVFKNDDRKWLLAREVTNVGLFSHYFLAGLIVLAISFYLLKKKVVQHPKLVSIYYGSKYFVYSLLFSGVITHIFKFIFGRQRPKISPNFDSQFFYFFQTNWDFQSMPSGHSQVLFTVATFLACYFPKQKNYLYFLAAIFAFTRVMTRDHFLSDVLGGFLVGHLSTLYLFQYLQKNNSKP